MSHKTDKELADEVDARERLKARGYEQKRCPVCSKDYRLRDFCSRCGGKGYVWEAPLMR